MKINIDFKPCPECKHPAARDFQAGPEKWYSCPACGNYFSPTCVLGEFRVTAIDKNHNILAKNLTTKTRVKKLAKEWREAGYHQVDITREV